MTEAAKDKTKEIAKDMMIPLGAVGMIVATAIGYGKTEAHVSTAQSDIRVVKAEVRELEKEFNKIDKKLNAIGYRMGVKNIEQIGESQGE